MLAMASLRELGFPSLEELATGRQEIIPRPLAGQFRPDMDDPNSEDLALPIAKIVAARLMNIQREMHPEYKLRDIIADALMATKTAIVKAR